MLVAFGAIRAPSGAGLRVPDDCSVVGFEDMVPAAIYNPPLTTTVRQPHGGNGYAGREHLA